ncbi:hypothetical protein [Lentibacillus cibarius]|uniref:Uncharacterized protein n=1 Tax=Lentibacillus cibarius TaxID=2583219 RepID=A0A5S3QNR5_9BACI|nr:hypothetical protein [Lentibacillus cibarius]TMN23298.1 hypothetical protein FFL34_15270 [Lentibacillus cibarius]
MRLFPDEETQASSKAKNVTSLKKKTTFEWEDVSMIPRKALIIAAKALMLRREALIIAAKASMLRREPLISVAKALMFAAHRLISAFEIAIRLQYRQAKTATSCAGACTSASKLDMADLEPQLSTATKSTII